MLEEVERSYRKEGEIKEGVLGVMSGKSPSRGIENATILSSACVWGQRMA